MPAPNTLTAETAFRICFSFRRLLASLWSNYCYSLQLPEADGTGRRDLANGLRTRTFISGLDSMISIENNFHKAGEY
jgi:hypothetical protein